MDWKIGENLKMDKKDKVSFVIPCYASAHTIEGVVAEVNETMKKYGKYEWEFVLINDSSPDNTYEVIKGLCEKSDNITGIDLSRNFGQHSALMAGFNNVSGDIVLCLDDDGQTPGTEVYKILDKMKEGYDVVYARYGNKQHSAFRNFGSKVNSIMSEILLDKPKDLFISSFFGVRRYLVDNMIKYNHAFPYVIGLVLRSTKNIANVDVEHRARLEGNSGYSLKKLIGLWMNGFTAFSVKPLRMATFFGVLMAFIGFAYAIFLVIRKLIYPENILLGWSSNMSAILVIGGLILFMLGIIGEYIGRIYICMNNAPQFIIKEMVGSGSKAESESED